MAVKLNFKWNGKGVLKDVREKSVKQLEEITEELRKETIAHSRIDTGETVKTYETDVRIEDGGNKIVGRIGANDQTREKYGGGTEKFNNAAYEEYGTGNYADSNGPGSEAKEVPWYYYDAKTKTLVLTHGKESRGPMQLAFYAKNAEIEKMIKEVLE